MKVASEFVRNQKTPQSELIGIGIPTLTIFSPKLWVEYCIRAAGEDDQEAYQDNQQVEYGPAGQAQKPISIRSIEGRPSHA